MFPKDTKSRSFPLKNKKIYFHLLAGTSEPKKLIKAVKILGAEVSLFFGRNLDFIVTNFPLSGQHSSVSPAGSDLSKENLSPKIDSPKKSSESPPQTAPFGKSLVGTSRGRAMLLAASQAVKSSATTPTQKSLKDVLARASAFGIKIITVDALSKWIQGLPEDVKLRLEIGEMPFFDEEAADVKEDADRDRQYNVRMLEKPCVKVIDLMEPTRPLFMERTNYLEPLWQSHPAAVASPSNAPPTTPAASLGVAPSTTTNTVPSRRDATATGPSNMLRRASSARRPKLVSKLSKEATLEPSGFCECCLTSFKNLYAHVMGSAHRRYAENPENFRHLDQLLAEIPSMEEVLAKARTKRLGTSEVTPKAPRTSITPGTTPTQQEQQRQHQESEAEESRKEHAVVVDDLDFSALPPLPTPSVPAETPFVHLFSDEEDVDADELPDATVAGADGGNRPSNSPLEEDPLHLTTSTPQTTILPSHQTDAIVVTTESSATDVTPQSTVQTDATCSTEPQRIEVSKTEVSVQSQVAAQVDAPTNLRQHQETAISTLGGLFASSSTSLTSQPTFRRPLRSLHHNSELETEEATVSIILPLARAQQPQPSSSMETEDNSPKLTQRFKRCSRCQRTHEPTTLTIAQRLKAAGEGAEHGGCGDTHDSIDPLSSAPPPSLPLRSCVKSTRARPKSTKRAASPPFPCAVCGHNVSYKCWSVLCTACGFWVHESCSKMSLVEIKRLPRAHNWTCPLCSVS